MGMAWFVNRSSCLSNCISYLITFLKRLNQKHSAFSNVSGIHTCYLVQGPNLLASRLVHSAV